MSESKVVKVLFVCYGNTCRSPMAEAVFKDLTRKKNVESQFEVDSAGISSWQEGQKPNNYVKIILDRNQICLNHVARQITVRDFEKYDFILGMDAYNLKELNEYAAVINSKSKICLLGDFNPDKNDRIIVDPFFDMRQEDFEKCFQQISVRCEKFLEELL